MVGNMTVTHSSRVVLLSLRVLLIFVPFTVFFPYYQQQAQQYAAARYLFGTLETANGQMFDQRRLSSATIAQKEHAAGISVANVTLAWKDYETADGIFNENQLARVVSDIKTFLQAGQKVDVQLAVHYVPSWVMKIPNAYYLNQYGIRAPQVYGFDDPNYIFNATVRQKVQDFETHALQQLNAQVGLNSIWDFRIDAGDGGEAYYDFSNDGKHHTNSYWAYDVNAQGTGNNLPTGVNATPFPNWKPGQTTYKGHPFTTAQVQQWYDWYFNARMNYCNWQVSLYRKAGFNKYLTFETPGSGTRPNEYTNNINHYLDGSDDPNGTMSRAAVWQKFYPAITNKTNIIAYISSIADSSGVPANNLCQASDRNVNIDTDTRVNNWSAVRYVSNIANKYGFLKGGENPGYGTSDANSDYGMTMMSIAAKQMQSCGLIGMFWAHDQNLYDGKNGLTLQDYTNIIAQYNVT